MPLNSLTLIGCSLFILWLSSTISRCQSVDCAKIEVETASEIALTLQILKRLSLLKTKVKAIKTIFSKLHSNDHVFKCKDCSIYSYHKVPTSIGLV